MISLLLTVAAFGVLLLGCAAPQTEALPLDADRGDAVPALRPAATAEPAYLQHENCPIDWSMVAAAEPKLLTASGAAASSLPADTATSPAGAGERESSIPFQAQSLDGRPLSLEDTRGAPTLLVFWAPW